MSTLNRIFTEKLGGSAAETFIGNLGDIFYDPATGQLKISDGATAGGKAVELAQATLTYPATKTIYVDKNRTDIYTATGNILTPYTTIQAAIDNATNFTTINIAPGVYAENIVMRDLEGVALVGSSEMNTTIVNVGENHTFSWIPGAVTGALVDCFAIKFMTIKNTSATHHALHIDAAAVVYPNVFISDEFDIIEVDIDGFSAGTTHKTQGTTNVYFRNVGRLYWNHGHSIGGDITVDDSSTFRVRNIEIGELANPGNLNLGYDGTHGYHNLLGRTDYTIATGSVIFGNLVITGHPIVQFDKTSVVVGNVVATSLTSYYSSGRNYCPLFSLYGQIGLAGGGAGNVSVTFPDPKLSSTGATANSAVDFSGAMIAGTVTLAKATAGPADDVARQYAGVLGTGTQFDKGTSGSILITGYVGADLRGAIFNQVALTGSTGIVDRDVVKLKDLTVTLGANAVAITPYLASGSYMVNANGITGGGVPIAFGASTKTLAGFGLVASAAGTADILITRV